VILLIAALYGLHAVQGGTNIMPDTGGFSINATVQMIMTFFNGFLVAEFVDEVFCNLFWAYTHSHGIDSLKYDVGLPRQCLYIKSTSVLHCNIAIVRCENQVFNY